MRPCLYLLELYFLDELVDSRLYNEQKMSIRVQISSSLLANVNSLFVDIESSIQRVMEIVT